MRLVPNEDARKKQFAITAHSVMEELLIYLCSEEASALIEFNDGICEIEDGDVSDSKEWVFDLFGDMDIISFLYSNIYLDSDHPYHFSHWADQQFYTE